MAAALAALLLLAGLAWATPVQRIAPSEAAEHEGHAAVRVVGQVQRPILDGAVTRFELHGGGSFLDVRVAGGMPLREGEQVEVEGSLGRRGGDLTLFATGPGHVTAFGTSGHEVSLAVVAADPQAWTDQDLELAGTVAGDYLGDSEGHHLRIAGPRFAAGPAHVAGTIAYAASCLCFELHPAWTR